MSWFYSLQAPGDVSKATPADGDVLKYDAATRTWKPAVAGGTVAGFVYFPDIASIDIDGTWRMGVVGTSFCMQRRESGTYVTKAEATP